MIMQTNSWRFVLPGADDLGLTSHPALESGLRQSPQGGVDLVAGDAAIRQAILLLLSTQPGERLMRPDYGCDLRQLLFLPNDDATAALAIYYVRHALTRWEPRIDLVTLDAHRDPDAPWNLIIELTYRVRVTGQVAQLALALDLTGGQS